MKNKKSMEVNPMSLVIAATILGLVLFVFIYGIFPIFTGKQIPWLKATVDETTKDCDGDEKIGLSDKCPCTSQNFDEATKTCPPPDSAAETNCPDKCKQFAGGRSGGAGGRS